MGSGPAARGRIELVTRRRPAAVLPATLLGLLLAGCGGAGGQAPSPAPTDATSAITSTTAPTSTSTTTSAAAGRTLAVDAFADLASQPGTVVLDVRTPDEFASGHLPGAVNLDVTSADFEAGLAGLDRAATYALYCRSGNRSADAMERMGAAGFGSLAHLEGGIGSWQAAGRPVVTGN